MLACTGEPEFGLHRKYYGRIIPQILLQVPANKDFFSLRPLLPALFGAGPGISEGNRAVEYRGIVPIGDEVAVPLELKPLVGFRLRK